MKMKIIYTIFFLASIPLFAQRTVGIIKNDSTALNGYTLIAPLFANETYLVNNCGDLVNSWRASTYQPGPVVYLLEDGSILRTCKLTTGSIITGGSGGRLERWNWNDSLVWSYNFDSPIYRQHHDVKVLPNGNILILAWDVKSRGEAITSGLDTTHFNDEIWSEKVTEIMPIGSDSAVVVWEWKLWDHLVQDHDSTKNNYGVISDNRHKVDLNYFNNNGISKDYFHANSLDYNPTLDQIMISIRNYDEFWVIDHSTTTSQAATNIGGTAGLGGDILYRWGNAEAYGLGDLSDKKLFGQHDPNWIPNSCRDGGQIIFFNNGYNDTNQISRAQKITPPIGVNGTYNYLAGQPFGPTIVNWSYEMPLFVDFVSGVNRLPNGNTLITSGPDAHIYELDPQDSVVWEYVSPVTQSGIVSQGATPAGNTVFRTYKYADNLPAFIVNPIRNFGPIELNPTPFNCQLYPSMMVSLNDAKERELEAFVVQNPIREQLHIRNTTNEVIMITVYDAKGQLIIRSKSNNAEVFINSSSWNPNLYVVIIQQGEQIRTHKVIKVN